MLCLPIEYELCVVGEPPNPRKKPPLTEIEIALKREETARKRKNLSEKKLEDEKVCARNPAFEFKLISVLVGRDYQSSSQETISFERSP